MTTTGITLVVLAIIGMLYGAKFLFISSVFESLGANTLIHLGLLLTKKFESKYFFIEAAVDLGYTIVILIISGAIFNWYTSTPTWILIIMAIVIYTFGCLINLFRVREDIKAINQMLEQRNSQQYSQ